jgi:hypothetical protein
MRRGGKVIVCDKKKSKKLFVEKPEEIKCSR